jgi:hypothetical protein
VWWKSGYGLGLGLGLGLGWGEARTDLRLEVTLRGRRHLRVTSSSPA